MEYRRLGQSDLSVSAVCLGTMTFGQQNSEADGHAQLDYACAHGVTFIDTAEMYPVPPRAETYGRTETIVGSWLRRQRRDRVILATKAAGPGRIDWVRGGPTFDRAQLRAAIEASLRRLGTDYVDLYQLHWPARNAPIFGQWEFDSSTEVAFPPMLEQLEALGELVREGKVRWVGVSNEHPWGVTEFLRLSAAHGLPRIVSTQNAYSLLNRLADLGLSEVLYREQVGLLAYSPLAFGHLSGKYVDDPKAPGRITSFAGFGQRYTKPNVQPAVEAYVRLARAHGLSPAQLALAWAYRRAGVTSTIIGATTLAQLEENIGAWSTVLAPDVRAAIDQIHLTYPNPAP